jgi:hypothetical protein
LYRLSFTPSDYTFGHFIVCHLRRLITPLSSSHLSYIVKQSFTSFVHSDLYCIFPIWQFYLCGYTL